MLRESGDREQLEDDRAEDPLPAVLEDPAGQWREESPEWVEEAFLSRIFDVPHGGRNSLMELGFSIESPALCVKRKMIINSDFVTT
jgi:hypothetical protein